MEAAPLDYEALFHDAPAGYLISGADGTVIEANRTLLSWLGMTRQELVGSSFLKLLPVGDRILYATHAAPQMGIAGFFAELAVDLIKADGARMPALLSASRIPAGGDGRPALDRIIVFNARERRLYEQELVNTLRKTEEAEAARASAEASVFAQQEALRQKDLILQASLTESRRKEALLETILNTVEVGVVVVDEAGNDILTNSRQIHNRQRAVPPGVRDAVECELLIFGPDRVTPLPPDLRPVRRAVLGGSYSEQLVWFGAGDGQQALSVSARSVRGSGAFRGSVIVFSDVTVLVNAVRAKDDFVANVSHELRTPLTSIMGYLDLLLDDAGDLPGHVTTSLQVAMRNSEKLLALVSDLLTAAAGGSTITLQATDLADLIRSAVTSAAPRADLSGVHFETDVPDTLPDILDPRRIGQVLDNLLSNAVKYSPGGGTVTVRARRSAAHTRIEIADPGIGMTEAEQGEVFTKFFRSATARRAAIPGVGLGLVISRKIIEEHHGTITLRSEPGRGTVFTVTLPVAQAPENFVPLGAL
ncbi:PAS domain-containing sensor histidine kinase [Arthrobacter sp. ATA002]|uniref:PAS domain-containing sensor histidine kinase n=1 Tax=Arthrobacter sp. ATA002 TaxID=2991715 RepID=UPI0022A68CF3|nr:PAS domain-containing sensor histidine kinase [Arthrobacter sp. ATA002]WAP52235.1 PAS domain-containing sensor histidine kinase [Arthrobacter sp. ATA002]